MKRGKVVGEVWATRKAASLSSASMKLVAVGQRVVVALDILDARVGQEVLVALGSGARNVLCAGPNNRHVLCDAAIALLPEGDKGVSDVSR